jgi:ribonuclease HI
MSGENMIKSYYAVRKGRKSNVVVKSWAECEQLVKGFPGAIYKGFGLYQKNEAYKFAESGDYGKFTPKEKPAKRRSLYETPHWPCIKRKSYTDPITGIYYKNRCVMRRGPTIVGDNYAPTGETGVPWQ